jgi:DNA-binding MarR family transcriptional regulator
MPDQQHVERLSQLYSRPGFLLRRAHQICVAIFEENFERLALSPAQYSVMIALHDLRGVNQGDLAKAIGMNKVTVSQIVQALESRGWITRKKMDSDRRRSQLKLTPAEQRALDKTAEMAEATYAEQMAPLSEPDRQRLFKLLQRIVDKLEPRARTPFEPIAAEDPA